MGCECAECVEHGGPNPVLMALKFVILGFQLLVAVLGLARERSWKALGVTLGAIGFFVSVPRYLICCRCEGYGEMCHTFYLGKLTSLYLPRVEGKEPTPTALRLEDLTLATLSYAPAVGLRKNRGLLALYLVLANMTLGLQFWHACRHCAEHATDWRRDCPSAVLARRVFASSREIQ